MIDMGNDGNIADFIYRGHAYYIFPRMIRISFRDKI
jgi:hypothetical protein